ncbi:MAG: amidohydrolase family protein [Candidatus Eremiobacteraeota bacterium]|nr:amidohydrolase family protein [Candidatus Eremiobacteraeota bacterium]
MAAVNRLALTGATVFPGPEDEPQREAVVLVHGNSIAAVESRGSVGVPSGTTVLDCAGCTIVAGFWNCHVHFHERKWANAAEIPAPELERQLQDFTRYGFTTVFDLSSCWENTRQLRNRIDSGEVAGPRIYSTGEGLIPLGGRPSADTFRVLGLSETALPEVASAQEAQRAASALVAAGVDGLKVFVSAPAAPQLSLETIRAVVNEARRAGKPVFAHPNSASDILAALDGGVDIIAHTTPHSGAWNADLIDTMRARGVVLIPTLMVWESMLRHDRISTREALVAAAVDQLRAWLERGGTVLFGTDLGAVEPNPAREYALMAEAGATFRQILASLTTGPAARFAAPNDAARITAGGPADIVVLEDDPAKGFGAFASVRYTLRKGAVIYGAP